MAQRIAGARRGLGQALDPLTSTWRRATDRRDTKFALVAVLILFVLAYPQLEHDNSHVYTATVAEIYILLALGLNVVVGFAGLLDLGYAAFFAIGAYTLALLGSAHFNVQHHTFSSALLRFGPDGIHVNFFLMIPIAAIVAALCGVLFGAPTLRLRGDYLAIVTLGFGEIVPLVIKNLGPDNSLGWPNITNGVNNITGIDSPPDLSLFGRHVTFQTNDQRPFYYLALVLVAVSIVMIYSLRDSRLGRAWSAIREDEIAAAHMGINITRTRLLAFGLGAAFSGFGGLLEAALNQSVDYGSFGFNVSIQILVMVILGGIGSVPGVILGAFLLTYLDFIWLQSINEQLNNFGRIFDSAPLLIGYVGGWLAHLDLKTAHPLIFGLVLLFMMLLRPQGLWPSRTRAREMKPETSEILSEENTELHTVEAE